MLLVAAACSGGGSASGGHPATSTAPSVPTVDTLPRTGTVRLSDGVIYTVVAPGTTLKLDNVTLRIDSVEWRRHVSVAADRPAPASTPCSPSPSVTAAARMRRWG